MIRDTQNDREPLPDMLSFPCIQALVQLFNVIFWFSGLSIIWLGIWLQTDFERYLLVSEEYSDVAPLVLIAVGSLIILVTSLACSCIVKVQPSMLIIYGGFLICMLFSLICVSIFVYGYKNELVNSVSSGIEREILEYESIIDTPLIDYIQSSLHCCGNINYQDWIGQRLPLSCCKATMCDFNNTININSLGCGPLVTNLIEVNLSNIGVLLTSMALFPLLGAILSFVLASNTPLSYKTDYELII